MEVWNIFRDPPFNNNLSCQRRRLAEFSLFNNVYNFPKQSVYYRWLAYIPDCVSIIGGWLISPTVGLVCCP